MPAPDYDWRHAWTDQTVASPAEIKAIRKTNDQSILGTFGALLLAERIDRGWPMPPAIEGRAPTKVECYRAMRCALAADDRVKVLDDRLVFFGADALVNNMFTELLQIGPLAVQILAARAELLHDRFGEELDRGTFADHELMDESIVDALHALTLAERLFENRESNRFEYLGFGPLIRSLTPLGERAAVDVLKELFPDDPKGLVL